MRGRKITAVLILVLSSAIFAWLGWTYDGMTAMLLWAFALLLLIVAVVMWLYRASGHEYSDSVFSGNPRTSHEREVERDTAASQEAIRVGLSGYWTDRESFGRFRRSKD